MSNSASQPDRPSQASPLSIITGLRACAMETSSRHERRALIRLADRLQRGNSIEDVLENDRYVPQYLREMVRAGIKNGKMGSVLEEYLSSSRESRSIWSEFFIGLIYPVVIIMLALLILAGFLMLVVPGFKSIFEDFGVELPRITSMMIGLSDWMAGFWWLYLFMVFSVPGLWVLHRFLPGRVFRVRVLQKIPIIGSARSMAAASEFCSRLALLVDCRLPLNEALFCLSKSIRDSSLAEISEKLSFRLERGDDTQSIARGMPNMLPALSSVFRWARDPDLFAEGLRASSQMFAAQARVRANQFSFLIEPFTVVLIATGAAFVMISCLMPLIKLLNELS